MADLDRIWTGWRAQYVNELGGADRDDASLQGSVFSQILLSGLPDSDTHIVHRGEQVFALLNAFPYTSGHLLVLPYQEIANIEDLMPEVAGELWATVTDAVCAVKAAYQPGGVNVGINLGKAAGGSVSGHLHVHVVPRWNGDANFMMSVAEARTLPEPLSISASKIRAAWPAAEQIAT